MGGRAEKLSEKYHYALNEAHNGYLETYLNSGFIGVFLLLTLIVLSLRSAWRNSKGGDLFEVYRAAFLLGIIGYNVTEATFNRLSLIWFAFLMVTLSYPHNPQSAPELIEYKESNRRMRILGRSPAPQLGFRPRAGKFPVK
jgi:O-antigen ligase